MLTLEEYINEISSGVSHIIEDEGRKLQRLGNTNYFKDDDDVDKPWAKSNLRDSIERVNVNDIETTERTSSSKLSRMGMYKIPEYGKYSTEYPIAIEIRNTLYLIDGHHRLELAKRAGEKYIEVAIKKI